MKALIIVDVQNDFLPEGALGVKGGDEVVPVINSLQDQFDCIVATKDWHPENHGSFAAIQGKKVGSMGELAGLPQVMWPVHCVQDTQGSEFAAGLNTDRIEKIFYKGIDPTIDSYSAFYDNARRRSTGLTEYLKEKGVTDVYIVGLTTDYCVKASAIDAVEDGFDVTVNLSACRPVNLDPSDEEKAVAELEAKGVQIVS